MSGLAHSDDKMTVEEFLAFAATRPDEEKWELIEGEPFMNATPAHLHQIIVLNLLADLRNIARQTQARWRAIPGIGVRLSEISAPVPDVLIRPRDFMKGVFAHGRRREAVFAARIRHKIKMRAAFLQCRH